MYPTSSSEPEMAMNSKQQKMSTPCIRPAGPFLPVNTQSRLHPLFEHTSNPCLNCVLSFLCLMGFYLLLLHITAQSSPPHWSQRLCFTCWLCHQHLRSGDSLPQCCGPQEEQLIQEGTSRKQLYSFSQLFPSTISVLDPPLLTWGKPLANCTAIWFL